MVQRHMSLTKNGTHVLFALWVYFVCRAREERHTAHVHTAKWDLKCTSCEIDISRIVFCPLKCSFVMSERYTLQWCSFQKLIGGTNLTFDLQCSACVGTKCDNTHLAIAISHLCIAIIAKISHPPCTVMGRSK